MPTKVAKQAATGPDKDSPRPTLDGSPPKPKPASWKEEVGFQALDRATTERSLVVDTLSDYINEGTTEVARLQRRQTSLATNLAKKVESLFVQVAFLEWRSRARHYAAQRHMKGREEYFEAEVAKMQKVTPREIIIDSSPLAVSLSSSLALCSLALIQLLLVICCLVAIPSSNRGTHSGRPPSSPTARRLSTWPRAPRRQSRPQLPTGRC